MQTVEKQIATGATISLDNKHYINCQFINCRLVYSGEDFVLTDTKIENCQIQLAGAAQRTVGFLTALGALGSGVPIAVGQPKVQ